MQRYIIIRMRIMQQRLFYSFLREITTKPHHWPCHLDYAHGEISRWVV